MNVLDLFSGIGGFSLGLERAGMRTVAFCEINAFCRSVLAKHWPGVPISGDVRLLNAGAITERVDLICGGFPCQDISLAGKGAGLGGERSGLWSEYRRLIEEIRPRWVVIENVSALRSRGLETILRQLAALGYDAEWHCVPACAVGAPHQRDRVWIVAYAQSIHGRGMDTASWHGNESQGAFAVAAHASQVLGPAFFREQSDRALQRYWAKNWEDYFEEIRGMDDGVSGRMDGLAALGNSIVPAVAEIIGVAIMRAAG